MTAETARPGLVPEHEPWVVVVEAVLLDRERRAMLSRPRWLCEVVSEF